MKTSILTKHEVRITMPGGNLVLSSTSQSNVGRAAELVESGGEIIGALLEVSAEISRLNRAAGETVFNPSATASVRAVLAKLDPKEANAANQLAHYRG